MITKTILVTSLALSFSAAYANEIIITGNKTQALKVAIQSNDSMEIIVDREPSNTLASKMRQLIHLSSTSIQIDHEIQAPVEIYVSTKAEKALVNMHENEMALVFKTVASVNCIQTADKKPSKTKKSYRTEIRPNGYSASSITANDINEMWDNSAIATANKIITDASVLKALKLCGIKINLQTEEANLHQLEKMTEHSEIL
ncbi:hypothetical protein ACP3V3_02380 [Vibrio sp. PNB22_3_1]